MCQVREGISLRMTMIEHSAATSICSRAHRARFALILGCVTWACIGLIAWRGLKAFGYIA